MIRNGNVIHKFETSVGVELNLVGNPERQYVIHRTFVSRDILNTRDSIVTFTHVVEAID